MGVRYGVYQHVLIDVFDSPAKCSNLHVKTPPTAAPNPSSTVAALIHIPVKAMRRQQGEKDMGTSLFTVLGKLTCFCFIVMQDGRNSSHIRSYTQLLHDARDENINRSKLHFGGENVIWDMIDSKILFTGSIDFLSL
jgi:hypothetical protein